MITPSSGTFSTPDRGHSTHEYPITSRPGRVFTPPLPDLLYLGILTGQLLDALEARANGKVVNTLPVVQDIGVEIARIRAGGDPS
jgi:hypothetical protein